MTNVTNDRNTHKLGKKCTLDGPRREAGADLYVQHSVISERVWRRLAGK